MKLKELYEKAVAVGMQGGNCASATAHRPRSSVKAFNDAQHGSCPRMDLALMEHHG